jgi:MFS transporter, UMF1 family
MPAPWFGLRSFLSASGGWCFCCRLCWLFAMAITIGMVQGGVQGMSRSLYASLIPAEHSGEFFGFYNMLTKFAHILGPVFVGTVAIYSDDPKFILIVLLPLFIFGALMLARIEPAATSSAA